MRRRTHVAPFILKSTLFVSKSRAPPSRQPGNTIARGTDELCVLASDRNWRAPCLSTFVEFTLRLSTLKHVEQRLLREYLDLPGLSLTLAQAARLMSVDAPTCEFVLNDRVNDQCLSHGESGTYVREARDGDLDRWKSLVRTRIAAVTHASPSLIRSVRPQMVDRRFAEPAPLFTEVV